MQFIKGSLYIYGNILLNSSYNWKCFRQNLWRNFMYCTSAPSPSKNLAIYAIYWKIWCSQTGHRWHHTAQKCHILCWRHFYHMWLELVNVVIDFGFHKMRGNSRLAQNQSASEEGLCSLK